MYLEKSICHSERFQYCRLEMGQSGSAQAGKQAPAAQAPLPAQDAPPSVQAGERALAAQAPLPDQAALPTPTEEKEIGQERTRDNVDHPTLLRETAGSSAPQQGGQPSQDHPLHGSLPPHQPALPKPADSADLPPGPAVGSYLEAELFKRKVQREKKAESAAERLHTSPARAGLEAASSTTSPEVKNSKAKSPSMSTATRIS